MTSRQPESLMPPKKTDSRSKRWVRGGTCQLEALPPDVLRFVLHEAVEGWLDADILARDREKVVETQHSAGPTRKHGMKLIERRPMALLGGTSWGEE